MESPSGYHLYAMKNNANDSAIKGSNNQGPAIHSDGKLQVDGQVIIDDSGSAQTAMSITSHTGNVYALDVAGKVRLIKDTLYAALQVINNIVTGSGGIAIDATGRIQSTFSGGSAAMKVEHTLNSELALDVVGRAQIREDVSAPYSVLDVIQDSTGNAIRSGGPFVCTGPADLDGPVDLDNILDLDTDTTGVAMDVNNANTDPAATAIKASGPIALDARGHVAIDSGKILSRDGTSRNNYIKYNSAESRIEFFIGSNLVFIVDSNGGHNP